MVKLWFVSGPLSRVVFRSTAAAFYRAGEVPEMSSRNCFGSSWHREDTATPPPGLSGFRGFPDLQNCSSCCRHECVPVSLSFSVGYFLLTCFKRVLLSLGTID